MTTNRIKELRRARGLSQSSLGAKIGTDKGGVSRLENGETRLDIARAREIADALGTTVEEVLGLGMPGLREDATPYTAAPGDPFARLLADNQYLYAITSNVLDEVGIKAGDLVLVDGSARRVDRLASGEAVVINVVDPADLMDQSKAVTLVRQFVPPRLLITNSRSENHAPINRADDHVAVLGVIVSRHTRLSS
ncbi:MAG: hypothetical protein RI936_19 [Pseudomonadota bacterium]|jgi:transcriptional regulator with XRE-family HTH domain